MQQNCENALDKISNIFANTVPINKKIDNFLAKWSLVFSFFSYLSDLVNAKTTILVSVRAYR